MWKTQQLSTRGAKKVNWWTLSKASIQISNKEMDKIMGEYSEESPAQRLIKLPK